MSPEAKVLIVGGGRTGWMAAAYLNAALADNGRRRLSFTVLEPGDEAMTSSAEAAIPELQHMLAVIGIDEVDFLRRVKGTFRTATRYSNWLRGTGDFFYHHFDDARAQPIDHAARDWLRSDRSVSFAETVSPQPIICELGLAPRTVDGPAPGLRLKYTYHADERAFAELLRDIAMSRGVEHRSDAIADIRRSADGNIEAVITSDGDRLEADLYVDCTNGSLPGPALDWVDCSIWLLCDRILTMNVGHARSRGIPPYTSATALSAGWVRDIPLQDRRSLSYIYSDRHATDAGNELRSFAGMEESEAQSQVLDVGHRAMAWSGNCVSLPAGVLDPLESADQYLADLGTITLAECFPFGDDSEACAYRYNRVMTNRYYELLDLINLQYCLTMRTDTDFWRDVVHPDHINPRLQAKLDFWRRKPPSKSDFIDQHLPGQQDTGSRITAPLETVFGLERYETVLYGMQFLADECNNWFGNTRRPAQVPPYIIGDIERARSTLPSHETFLRGIAG